MADRLESTNALSVPDVGPLRISPVDYQARSVEAPAAAAATSNATDALVQGRTLPGLTLTDDSSSAPGRLAVKADGSMDATVKAGDNLWRIAREALEHGHDAGYKPSNKDIQAAVGAIARENQMKNPDLIHPGDVIHIPKELTASPAATAPAQPGQDATPRQSTTAGQDTTPRQDTTAGQPGDQHPTYKMHGEAHNASRAFGSEVLADFERLPQNVRRLLAESGDKIAVAGKLTDLYPNAGNEGDQLRGRYDPTKKALVLAETHLDPATGSYVRDDNGAHTFNFVAGRAVDAALGNVSQSDEFKRAFDADVAGMSPADKVRFAKLIQSGDNGRMATFAEVFASSNSPSTNNDESQAVLRDFGNVKAMMQARLAQLPA